MLRSSDLTPSSSDNESCSNEMDSLGLLTFIECKHSQWAEIQSSVQLLLSLINSLFPCEPQPVDTIVSRNVQLSVRKNRIRSFRHNRNWFCNPLSSSPMRPSTGIHSHSLLGHPKLVESIDLSKYYRLFEWMQIVMSINRKYLKNVQKIDKKLWKSKQNCTHLWPLNEQRWKFLRALAANQLSWINLFFVEKYKIFAFIRCDSLMRKN